MFGLPVLEEAQELFPYCEVIFFFFFFLTASAFQLSGIQKTILIL